MLTLEEMSDRFEIQQLLVDYSTAIFTPDAYIDYRAMGGIDGHYPEVKAWLAEILPNFPAYSHMLGNLSITFAEDRGSATSRVICFNPMVIGDPDSPDKQVLFCGLWYDDEFVRTAAGWRMTRRVETKCFDKLV
jgi:hypothetical protein